MNWTLMRTRPEVPGPGLRRKVTWQVLLLAKILISEFWTQYQYNSHQYKIGSQRPYYFESLSVVLCNQERQFWLSLHLHIWQCLNGCCTLTGHFWTYEWLNFMAHHHVHKSLCVTEVCCMKWTLMTLVRGWCLSCTHLPSIQCYLGFFWVLHCCPHPLPKHFTH